MSDNSKIEWTDATWNPIRGCSRVSEGCRNCYAEGIAARFSNPGQAFHTFAKVTAPRDHLDASGGRRNGWTGKVELIEGKLLEPLSWREPRKVFVNSMSDLFHERLSDEAIDRVFAVMALCPQHAFQVLTKRPERMLRYCRTGDSADTEYEPDLDGEAWRDALIEGQAQALYNRLHKEDPSMWLSVHQPLPNVWLGVSCENQATADERIPLLLETPAAVRFVSAEPLLGPIDLHPKTDNTYRLLDWLIAGAESGHGARDMDEDWVRSLRDQCVAAGVAFFYKQKAIRGKKFPLPELDGKVWAEFPRV